jgi:hypothetical protein
MNPRREDRGGGDPQGVRGTEGDEQLMVEVMVTAPEG